jgi:glycosyltransferase involved in cell wall biosynthesis
MRYHPLSFLPPSIATAGIQAKHTMSIRSLHGLSRLQRDSLKFSSHPQTKIAIVVDTDLAAINGVATRTREIVDSLKAAGHEVLLIDPDSAKIRLNLHRLYPMLKASFDPGLEAKLQKFSPDKLLIMSEGTLGNHAQQIAMAHRWPFATWYTTNFGTVPPAILPRGLSGPYDAIATTVIRGFHHRGPNSVILVNTQDSKDELISLGYQADRVQVAGPAVNKALYGPERRDEALRDTYPKKPIFLYVGRLSSEKNLDAFLSAKLPGCKWVVGDGPDEARLKRLYGRDPNTHFLGKKLGDEKATLYASADVFVLPSGKFETMGRVVLEALASGTPVAVLNEGAPQSLLTHGGVPLGQVGAAKSNIQDAALAAWDLVNPAKHKPEAIEAKRQHIAEYAAQHFDWSAYIDRLLQVIPSTGLNAREASDNRLAA